MGLIVVVGTLTILMFILIAAIVILFFTSRLKADEITTGGLLQPSSPLEVDRVDPALALASLGGVVDSEVIRQAIAKDRPETAFAAVLYQPGLSDRETAGSLLLLAPIYIAKGERAKGLFCFKLAGTVTTLSPDLADTTRADLFIEIGEGLFAINETELARFYFDQAFTLAGVSPYLQVVHRRSIFERLQKNYIALGERTLARQSLDLSANPPNIALITGEGAVISKNRPIALAEAVQSAEAARWLKAQELAALLVERGGRAPQSAYEALREALIVEDNQKLSYYEAELEAEAQVSRKIDITFAKIEWLSVKYRIARKAYGLSLVPEWEAQAEQIRSDLTKTYETLFALYGDLVVALPEISEIDRATEEKLRREVLAGELGRYPNYPEDQRQQQLIEASQHLVSTQAGLNIGIEIVQVDNEERYTLVYQASSGE